MNKLDQYIEYLKTFISSDETTMIMQVYIDLAKRLNFDSNFYFGGSKAKKELYFTAPSTNFLNNCFELGKITCKASSYILNYILKRLDVDIKVIEDNHTFKKYRHIYNIIKEKNGRLYSIDLQDDIMNIRHKAMTTSFGLSNDEKSYVVPLIEQKKIHKNIGYINNCYYDDYIYLIKSYISMFEDNKSKIDFVLNNIDLDKNNVSYFDRRWMHEKVIRLLFNDVNLYPLELYKKDNNNKEYINAFYLNVKNKVYIYIYSQTEYRYKIYSLEEYINYSIDNNIESRNNIPGFRSIKNKILSNKYK